MINAEQPQYQHFIRLFQKHSIRRCSVLLLGNEPKPLTNLLENLECKVQSLPLSSLRNNAQVSEKDSNIFTRIYDVIILDDILQYFANPYVIIRSLNKQLAKGGILIITSPNIARGSMRLKLLCGKNLYQLNDNKELSTNNVLDYVNAFCKEYTLKDLRTLLRDESFVIVKSSFFNVNKTPGENHSITRWIYQLIQRAKPSLRDYIILLARGNFADDFLDITKEDPFKLKSMHVFNSKWISSYDSPTLFNRFFTKRWDKEVLKQLPGKIDTLRILDVGCGWGRLLTAFADEGAKHLAGTDLAPRMVDLVRQRLSERGVRADMQIADVEDKIPWESNFFDVITLTGSFHHFYRPFDAIQEIHRVLKKGGIFIITDPWFFTPVRQCLNYLCSFKGADGDYRFYTTNEVSKMLSGQGFTVSETKRWINSFLVTAMK